MRHLIWLVLPFAAACTSDHPAQAHTNDPLQAPRGLESAVLVPAPDNALTAAKFELGKQLFFDPRLSGSGTMSCSSCHLPEKAFTDGNAVSKKDDGKDNTRNSPTMHNVGYYERLYWDGRAKGLEANIGAAWKAQLAGNATETVKRLSAVPAYTKAFQDAFGGPASEDTIVKAVASFLRALRSGDSAYDRAQGGKKDALNDKAQKGMALFNGKAGCVVCHTPPLFTDRLFHNTGIGMQAEKPDVGAASDKALNDPTKTGAFKTPTLRDVAKTAPYFHDGSVKTLAEAVKHMASGGQKNPHLDPLLLDRALTDDEVGEIVAFLESLNGNQTWTAPQVPK